MPQLRRARIQQMRGTRRAGADDGNLQSVIGQNIAQRWCRDKAPVIRMLGLHHVIVQPGLHQLVGKDVWVIQHVGHHAGDPW